MNNEGYLSGAKTFDELTPREKLFAKMHIVVILTAMREPTEEMIQVGENYCSDTGTPEGVWCKMIDAALKE